MAGENVVEILAAARQELKNNLSLLDAVASDLAAAGQEVEPDVLQAMRSMRLKQWIFLRSIKSYAIFIDPAVENAYAVLGAEHVRQP